MPLGKEYSKEVYHYLKNKKVCVSCAKEEAEPNSVYCLECKEKSNKRKRDRYNNDLEYRLKEQERIKLNARERRKRLKEKGLCIICGKRKINYPVSKTRCVECYIKRKRAEQEKQIQEGRILRLDRYKYDLCYNCNEKGLFNNTKYCKKCWTKMSNERKKWWKNNSGFYGGLYNYKSKLNEDGTIKKLRSEIK